MRHPRLHEYLAQHLGTQPEKCAVRFAGKEFSYRKLAGRPQRIAARFVHEWAVKAGDRVAYLGANHVDCFSLLAACGIAGAIYLPLNVRLAVPELAAIVADAKPSVIVCDAAHAAIAQSLVASAGANCALHDIDVLVAQPCAHPAPQAPTQDNDVLLVYTSGTTGQHKGVLHTLDGMAANIAASIHGQHLRSDHVVLCALPLFHVGGLCIQALPALAAGATVLLHARFDAAAWLADVQAHRPTHALMVPATLRAVVTYPQWAATDLSCFIALCAGSSVIPGALIDAVQSRGVALTQVYGSTETGPTSTVLSVQDAWRKPGCAGKPALGVEMLIHAPNAQGVGEVLVRGPNLMRRYAGHSASGLSESGWYATGDLGRLDADGALWIMGRAKDMLIAGGENIYPAELEQVLAGLPQLADCAVVGLPDPTWGEVPAACVVRAPGQAIDAQAVLAAFEGKLARFKHPKHVIFLPELPKNAMGKVEKPKLVKIVSGSLNSSAQP